MENNLELNRRIPDAKDGGHTMTPQQALEVLKEHQEWRLGKLYMNATHSEITQALTIAIECMEARRDEIMKAYEQGWFDRDGGKSMYSSSEQYYNSLTNPYNIHE